MDKVIDNDLVSLEERKLGTKKIRPLFAYTAPSAVLGMSMQMTMSIADGFFVGNGIGSIGLGTISVVYPFWIIAIAFGTMFGVGASTLVGIKLGKGEKENARAVVGQIFWYTNFFSIFLSVIILIFLDNILIFWCTR